MTTQKLAASKRASLGAAVKSFQGHLLEARDYLVARGINSQAVAEGFQLGVVGRDAPIEFQRYAGRLSIPYLDGVGVSQIRFRCMEAHDCGSEGHSKYDSLPGLRVPLYNVRALRDPSDDVVAICEGEMDTIVLAGFCGVAAVGLGGANAWKGFYRHLFDDYTRVLVVGDGDKAGRKMTHELAGHLESAVPIRLDEGEDVNSVFLREGAPGVRRRLGLAA